MVETQYQLRQHFTLQLPQGVNCKSFLKNLFQVSHELLHCLSMSCGQNTVSNPCVKVSLTDLHAVHDETQEDESIVAVVNFHIFYNPLTHLSKVAGFWKLPLIHKAGPRSNGHATLVKPFFGYTGRNSFREPKPVEKKNVARAVQWQRLFNQSFIVFNILMKVTLGAEMYTEGFYFAMIPAPPVPVGWASSALKRSPALLSMSTWQFSPLGAPDTIYRRVNCTEVAAETHINRKH